MKRPELLVPASSLEVLKVAVIYGADAVYIGGEAFDFVQRLRIFQKKICVRESHLPIPMV